MEKAFDNFSLKDTMHSIFEAAYGVSCHILFDGACHGLIVALILLAAGFLLAKSKHRLSSPFLAVGRKLGICCTIVAIPGAITLLTKGGLPPCGYYNINSIGYFSLWSLICAHMVGEEINYQWTVKNPGITVEEDSEAEPLAR